ncbi:MAG TPA: histidine kinase, partial [Fimbriimonadaceae bacterium]|nr:histidine kinase [Fimbriimonadaceae bacterium]
MPEKKEGRLKIFLSFAVGTGKTFAMLDEAHRRKNRGQDVVIGLVDAKGRQATDDQVHGFEVIATKKVSNDGRETEELDTDGIIARHPDLVLIDDLAHSNAPGAKHQKRWQDVQEILDNGINVLTTLNVYHLVSLNDQIEDITG